MVFVMGLGAKVGACLPTGVAEVLCLPDLRSVGPLSWEDHLPSTHQRRESRTSPLDAKWSNLPAGISAN